MALFQASGWKRDEVWADDTPENAFGGNELSVYESQEDAQIRPELGNL